MVQVYNHIVLGSQFLKTFEEKLQVEERYITTVLTNAASFFREFRTPFFMLRWGWYLLQVSRRMPDVHIGIQLTAPANDVHEEVLEFSYDVAKHLYTLQQEHVPHIGVPQFNKVNWNHFSVRDVLEMVVLDEYQLVSLNAGESITLDDSMAQLYQHMMILKIKSLIQRFAVERQHGSSSA